jgi:hypothetical protein
MPAHPPTQLSQHLTKRAAAGSSYADLLVELRRYRDRLRPYEYQELLLLSRSLTSRPTAAATNGNGNGHRNGWPTS